MGEIDFRNSRVAWFVELETARKKGDAELAEQAAKELRRLGVDVRYFEHGGVKGGTA